MAYSEGQLSGARDYRVGIEINYSGVQDWNANTSRFDWYVWFISAENWGSYSGSTQYGSANIGGVIYNFTFGIPESERYNTRRLIAAGSTWHGHDGAGYRSGFPSSAYLDTDHSNILDGGSGDAWVDAPRIPILPDAPTPIGLDQITPTSMRYRFSGNADGGAAIQGWEMWWGTTPSADQFSEVSSGTSIVTNMKPGTTYYFKSRGRNVRGLGAFSSVISARTMSGAYVWTGSEWAGSEVLVRNSTNTDYVSGEVWYRNAANTAWVLAS